MGVINFFIIIIHIPLRAKKNPPISSSLRVQLRFLDGGYARETGRAERSSEGPERKKGGRISTAFVLKRVGGAAGMGKLREHAVNGCREVAVDVEKRILAVKF